MQAPAKKSAQKRKSVRYKPDPGDFARIDPDPGLRDKFNPQYPALVIEEAAKGCGLVVTGDVTLDEGDVCKVQVGKVGPVLAEVRWRLQIDKQIFKIGLMYLE